MTRNSTASLVLFALLGLAACDPYDPTMRPDYAIRVKPTAQGGIAIPPACPSWATEVTDNYDNQPVPQFGCADARNLAAMVERPDDLLAGRPLGATRGVTQVGAVRRYDNNQPRGLITPDAEVSQLAITSASTGTSAMTGDITGSASSSAPAASAAAAP